MPDPPRLIEYADSECRSNAPRPIEYASFTTYGEIDIRRDGDKLTIAIPPPATRRTILWQIVRDTAICVVFAAAAPLFLGIPTSAIRTQAGTFRLVSITLAILVFMEMSLFRLWRITRTGTRPTFILASASELEIREPRRRGTRSRRWATANVLDVSARELGPLRIIVRYVKLRVILRGEWMEDFLIPWNGNGALANVEDNLRDVLGLQTDAPAPPAAPLATAPPAAEPPAEATTPPTSSEAR